SALQLGLGLGADLFGGGAGHIGLGAGRGGGGQRLGRGGAGGGDLITQGLVDAGVRRVGRDRRFGELAFGRRGIGALARQQQRVDPPLGVAQRQHGPADALARATPRQDRLGLAGGGGQGGAQG